MFYESLTSLAFCAAATENIRLGVAVLILPYREPLFTAKQIATIDDLSGGRLDLGIGQGAAASTHNVDFEVLGVSRATKVRRTREHLDAMLKIWQEDSPSFEGRFYNFADATIYPKPRQRPHPPLWIGGSATNPWRWWRTMPTPGFPAGHSRAVPHSHRRSQSPVGRQRSRARVDDRRFGDPDPPRGQRGPGEARRRQDHGRLRNGVRRNHRGVRHDQQSTSTLNEIWESSLIGTPEQVRDRIEEYVSAGCTYFELKFIYHDLEHLFSQWRTFADVVCRPSATPAEPAIS